MFYSLTGLLSGDDPELAVKFVTFKNNGKLAAVSQKNSWRRVKMKRVAAVNHQYSSVFARCFAEGFYICKILDG
ncbi:hypothetical protein AALB51_17005 [Lachnospiraceae bacterium 62-26]